MNYGRIRRGPMAADAFTQIRNALFRDPRISFKAKGVFGLISTHRDGYGVSAESIAACSKDGVSGIKAALRELEGHGYLRRTQAKNVDGTFGTAVYYITDQPEAFEDSPALESRRSAPSVENPPTDYPPAVEPPTAKPLADEPPAENHLHKKTSSKHTGSKKTSSSRLPKPRKTPAVPSATLEEEGSSASSNDNRARLFLMTLPAPWGLGPADAARLAPQLAAAVGRLGLDYDDQLSSQIAVNPGAVNDFASVIERRRIPNLKPPAVDRSPRTPDWCGHCNRGEQPVSLMQRTVELPDGRDVKCPACHPAALAAAA